jgi:hypothetical protein
MSMFHPSRPGACAVPFIALAGISIANAAPPAKGQSVSVSVDAASGRRAISPYVYGVAFPDTSQVKALNVTWVRHGGNATSRYNWTINASNRAADWYFESIGESSATPGDAVDSLVGAARSGGVKAGVTIPMIDWLAKLGPNRAKRSSFSVARYGPQQSTDPWWSDAGNGVRPDGHTQITGNDPNDAHVRNAATTQTQWLQHLNTKWGVGGVPFFFLDNEVSIWYSSHRDVAPRGLTLEQTRDRMISTASLIKQTAPSALVFGPEEWGWGGYIYSGADQQDGPSHGWTNLPDISAHGGQWAVPWYLSQMRAREQVSGKRLLDVLSLHYYPQGGEFSNDTSAAMQQRRNRSTRSLWDPNYVDASWINDKVMLVPRMKAWVQQYYPNTKVALTEYNWGAEGHISGATAQADILGILGREGLDYAARWTTPSTGSPTFKAFQMYRNYDGNKGSFGDMRVGVTNSANPDSVAVFAAQRSADSALTVMIVNKATSQATVGITLKNFQPGTKAQVRQLTSANAIKRLADATVSSAKVSVTAPGQSITHVIVPRK